MSYRQLSMTPPQLVALVKQGKLRPAQASVREGEVCLQILANLLAELPISPILATGKGPWTVIDGYPTVAAVSIASEPAGVFFDVVTSSLSLSRSSPSSFPLAGAFDALAHVEIAARARPYGPAAAARLDRAVAALRDAPILFIETAAEALPGFRASRG